MIKKGLSLIVAVLLLICCTGTAVYAENTAVAVPSSVTLLRAGGGQNSGSGASGGGQNGTPNGDESVNPPHFVSFSPTTSFHYILQYILLTLAIFSSSILFYITLSKRSRKAKKLMKQMMQHDNAWKYNDILDTVNDCYFAVQTAWAAMDMSTASPYMSDELRESFQTKLNWMAYRHEKNVLENVQLLRALPVAVHDDPDNSHDYVWFYIKGSMVDYTIDTDTQATKSGHTFATSFAEYWQFMRCEERWVLHKILQKDESDQICFND